MVKHRRRRVAHPWIAQGALIAAVVVASALFVTAQHGTRPGALPAPRVLGEPPIVRDDATAGVVQDVTAERPAGSLIVAVSAPDSSGRMDVTVTDTRPDDPGWSVGLADGGNHAEVSSATSAATAPFEADGRSYAQQVVVDPGGHASAPAGHGLGIAHLTTTAGGQDVVSLTVV